MTQRAMPEITFTAAPRGEGFGVFANSKPVTTLGGSPLVVRTQGQARALADEMAQHGKKGPLYRLTSMALDQTDQRPQLAATLVDMLDTDLVCYRARDPEDLVAFQQQYWEPVVAWAKTKGLHPLEVTTLTHPISQPAHVRTAYAKLLAGLDDAAFLVCVLVARLAGSSLLALAFVCGDMGVEGLFNAAYADDLYQQARYTLEATLQARLDQGLRAFEELAAYRDLFAPLHRIV